MPAWALPAAVSATCRFCSGAWLAVTVRVAEPPAVTVVLPVIVRVGTLAFLIVVCAEPGVPTV